MRDIFVTGTDTGVGKTLVACALLRAFAAGGLRAVGMKPVASGCQASASGLASEDAAQLVAASNVRAPLEWVNPYCFAPAIAPHLAAQQAGTVICLEHIGACYRSLAALADRVVVEGAGGLLVPLDAQRDFGHLASALELSVVLVVGMRLGCLNHALLSAQAVRHRGLRFAGWIANCIEPDMACLDENLHTLRQRLTAPLIGVMPFAPDASQVSAAIDVALLGAQVQAP